MDASKLTSRSIEVINAASTIAVNQGNPQVDPVHLAAALTRQEKGITPSLISRTGADLAGFTQALDQACREHAAMVDALRACDRERLHELAVAHMDRARQLYVEKFLMR